MMSAKILPFPPVESHAASSMEGAGDGFVEAVSEIHAEVATILSDLVLYAAGRPNINAEHLAVKLNGAASLLRMAGDSIRRRATHDNALGNDQ